MTKAEIVNEISKKTGIDKATVLTAVEAFMESRNISKNTTIIIDEHNIPAFKPAKVFVDAIKK